MRASHMPSLPEMPFEHHDDHDQGQYRRMKLKILYTVEDNTFLARSSNILNVKTLPMPIPGQRNMMTLGVVSLKEVLQPIQNSSPELFVDDSIDYSVYVKDISEEDEPFVGYGLFHKILSGQQQQGSLDDEDDESLIPGRVCSNFAALLSKNTSETLEIKLRLARVISRKPTNNNANQQSQQQPQSQQQLQQQQPQQSQQNGVLKRKNEDVYNQSRNASTPTNNNSTSPVYPELSTFQIPQQKPQIYDQSSSNKKQKPMASASSNAAVKASRTQSLPAFNQPLNQLNPSQLASMGYFPPSTKFFPASTIAGQIRQADEIKQYRTNYSFQVDGLDGNNTKPITVAPSNRFAPNFISSDAKKYNKSTKKPRSKKQTTSSTSKTTSKAQPKSQTNSMKSSPAPSSLPFKELPKSIPECFNCQTVSAPVWRYYDGEDEPKRGMYCNTCYIYLMDKGTQRPKSSYDSKLANFSKKDQKAGITSSSPVPSSNSHLQNNNQHDGPKLHSMKHEQTSSDPAEEFHDMVSSDLDFNFGPMTDIDPLPQQKRTPQIINTEDKENVPPISIQKLSRQNSFEKMLIKSFSGVPPNMNNMTSQTPNNEWLNEFFEPTPKDQPDQSITPKDYDNTPRDLATCNTLPCEDESPPSQSQQQSNISNNSNDSNVLKSSDQNSVEKDSNLKVSMMPSSPFNLNTQDVTTSSPETVDHTSDWLSEHTKLSSMDNEIPSEKKGIQG